MFDNTLAVVQVMIILAMGLALVIQWIKIDLEAIRLNQEDRIREMEAMLMQAIETEKAYRRNEFLPMISRFNVMHGLPSNTFPTIFPGESFDERLSKFKRTILAEVMEVDKIIQEFGKEHRGISVREMAEHLADVADWLCDIQIYRASEMRKFGLPQPEIMAIIMESNFSKLGADGKPIINADGKVQKGPRYWKPEPKIVELLTDRINRHYGAGAKSLATERG